MSYEEAIAWLKGERSTTSTIPQEPYETWQIRIYQADADLTKQAYYIVKAYTEKLIK